MSKEQKNSAGSRRKYRASIELFPSPNRVINIFRSRICETKSLHDVYCHDVRRVLPPEICTSQDLADLDFALQVRGGIDVVALSFVQKPEDVQELKDIVKGRCRVMAKIEKPQAVDDLEEIVALCDAIMVAR